MADPVVNSLRIDNLEGDCKEIVRRVDGLDDECAEMSDRIHAGEMWRNGNGARGAEVRLQLVEAEIDKVTKCIDKVASDESIAKIASVAVKGVIDNAKNRDRTVISKAKAFAPYFAGICGVATAVIVAVLK